MTDFGYWFRRQGAKPKEPPKPVEPAATLEDLYPELELRADSSWWATCRSCKREYELLYEPEEFTEEGNYCGGSDRCLP